MKKKNEVHQLFQSFRHHQIMQNEAIAVKSFEKNPPFWLLHWIGLCSRSVIKLKSAAPIEGLIKAKEGL